MLEMREQGEKRNREDTVFRNVRKRRNRKERKMLKRGIMKGGNAERGQCSKGAMLEEIEVKKRRYR